ncbi:MAG TPA: hypothetical protein V6C81_31740 [Planktothrix sp.]|jgi:hypothetical protein
MRYHFASFFTGIATLTWVAALVLFLTGHVHFDAGLVSAILSSSLAVAMFIRRNDLLLNYAAPLERIQLRVCLTAGPALAVASIVIAGLSPVSIIGALCLVFWVMLYIEYRSNKADFVRVKSGLVFKNAWPSPYMEAVRPGDLLVTEGIIGPKVGMVVDHGELALRDESGEMVSFSSWWEKGSVFSPLARVTKGSQKNGPFFVARPTVDQKSKTGLTEAQTKRLYEIAQEMYADNHEWTEQETVRRTSLIKSLWLPGKLKEKLLKKVLPDGYDWFGLAIGHRRKHSWTCIGACVEAYARLIDEEKKAGRPVPKTRKYGIGLFGLGTGFADPIAPIKVMTDPAMRLLDLNDKAEFEAAHPEVVAAYAAAAAAKQQAAAATEPPPSTEVTVAPAAVTSDQPGPNTATAFQVQP